MSVGNRVLEFIIRAKDSTDKGIKSVREKFAGLGNKVGGAIKGMMGSMVAMAGISLSVGAAVKLLGAAISTAFKFEKYETSFKILFGSLEAAQTHMADLKELAKGTFNFEQLADASQKMMVLTKNVLGGKESLRMLADAAQATGSDLPALAQDLGNAFSSLTSGGDINRALHALEMTGAVSKETGQKLREMEEKGASLSDMWKLLEGDLLRFKGAVETASTTGEEMIDSLKDAWGEALAEFGQAFMDLAKGGIGSLTDKLNELREDGTIAVWANKAKDALVMLQDSLGTVGRGLAAVYKWSGLSDAVANVKGVAAAAGSVAGGDIKGAFRAYQKEAVQGNYQGMINKAVGDPLNLASDNDAEAAAKAKDEAKIRAAASDKYAGNAGKKEADAAKKVEDERAKIKAALEKGQIARDKKAAEEKAKAEEAARKKAAEELAEKEKQAMRARIDEEVALKKGMIDELTEKERSQQDRMARAEQAANQAWAEYKDPELMKTRKEAEAKEKEFQERFAKDKERVGFKVAAGFALTEQEQAAQNVMKAEEEKKEASKALTEIEKNTRDLAKKVDELLKMKG